MASKRGQREVVPASRNYRIYSEEAEMGVTALRSMGSVPVQKLNHVRKRETFKQCNDSDEDVGPHTPPLEVSQQLTVLEDEEVKKNAEEIEARRTDSKGNNPALSPLCVLNVLEEMLSANEASPPLDNTRTDKVVAEEFGNIEWSPFSQERVKRLNMPVPNYVDMKSIPLLEADSKSATESLGPLTKDYSFLPVYSPARSSEKASLQSCSRTFAQISPKSTVCHSFKTPSALVNGSKTVASSLGGSMRGEMPAKSTGLTDLPSTNFNEWMNWSDDEEELKMLEDKDKMMLTLVTECQEKDAARLGDDRESVKYNSPSDTEAQTKTGTTSENLVDCDVKSRPATTKSNFVEMFNVTAEDAMSYTPSQPHRSRINSKQSESCGCGFDENGLPYETLSFQKLHQRPEYIRPRLKCQGSPSDADSLEYDKIPDENTSHKTYAKTPIPYKQQRTVSCELRESLKIFAKNATYFFKWPERHNGSFLRRRFTKKLKPRETNSSPCKDTHTLRFNERTTKIKTLSAYCDYYSKPQNMGTFFKRATISLDNIEYI